MKTSSIIIPKLVGLVFTLSIAVAGCSNLSTDEAANAPIGETDSEKPPATILGIDALRGEQWNLATLGRREEGGSYLSKGSKITVEDLWLIERSSGDTVSLLPDRQGEIIDSYFLSQERGPVGSSGRHSGNRTHVAYAQDDLLRFYLIKVASGKKQIALYGGTVADKQTVKLGGPFDAILHLDMLEDGQLAVYVKRNVDEVVRLVFDLNTLTQTGETSLDIKT